MMVFLFVEMTPERGQIGQYCPSFLLSVDFYNKITGE
jgi:hypothetical protein